MVNFFIKIKHFHDLSCTVSIDILSLQTGFRRACMHAKSLQLCLTLCDPMDCSLPGSSDHGIHSPGKNIGMDCHFLLQGIFPRRDGTHVSYDSCIGWPVLCHERHLDIRSLQCKTRAGFLGLIHADKSPEDLRNVFLSEGLQSGPPSPFLLPFHTLRNCLQTAAPLFFFFFFLLTGSLLTPQRLLAP